ncbi:hypothetical protein DL93DRAFT_772101 [Clavulina sp. PMI_390]|nr:hypothetical protein DL93DRAFT_772101 [Clavulina sp. PMI_390]
MLNFTDTSNSSDIRVDVIFVPLTSSENKVTQPARRIYSMGKRKLASLSNDPSLLCGRFLVMEDNKGLTPSYFTRIVDLATGKTYSLMTMAPLIHIRIWKDSLVTIENGSPCVYPLSELHDSPDAAPREQNTPSTSSWTEEDGFFCAAISQSPIFDDTTREHAFSTWADPQTWESPAAETYSSQLYAIPPTTETVSSVPTQLDALPSDARPLWAPITPLLPSIANASAQEISNQFRHSIPQWVVSPPGTGSTEGGEVTGGFNIVPDIQPVSEIVIRSRQLDSHQGLTRLSHFSDPSQSDYFILSRRTRGRSPKLVHEPLMLRLNKGDSSTPSGLNMDSSSSLPVGAELWKFDAGYTISSEWNEISGRICVFVPGANQSLVSPGRTYTITLYDFAKFLILSPPK